MQICLNCDVPQEKSYFPFETGDERNIATQTTYNVIIRRRIKLIILI